MMNTRSLMLLSRQSKPKRKPRVFLLNLPKLIDIGNLETVTTLQARQMNGHRAAAYTTLYHTVTWYKTQKHRQPG